MKTRILSCLFAAGLLAALVGCAVTNFNQSLLNTGAEGITGQILASNPADLAAIQALAAALPTAIGPNSSLDSAALGDLMATQAKAKGVSPASSVKLVTWFDGALRNANAFQGGGNGGPPTVQAAIAAQILAVVADGMNHAVVIYKHANSIP